jgi:uncharacterized protein
MSDQAFTREQGHRLLRTAEASIAHGLSHGCALPVDRAEVDPALRQVAASFVTLTIDGQLRGCIGRLEAEQPLIADVAENAYAAAFTDPRFPPLRASELPLLRVEISVLGPSEPLTCEDEDGLLAQLRPGVDGLILREGSRKSTFLPSVWEQLPDPQDFLHELKRKAGLPRAYWSDLLEFRRYTTTSIRPDPHHRIAP